VTLNFCSVLVTVTAENNNLSGSGGWRSEDYYLQLV